MLALALLACSGGSETSCDEATLTLESIAADPEAMAATQGTVCGGFYEARTGSDSTPCGDSGLEEPELVEGVYAVWPSDWGIERRGYSLGVVVLADDGVTELQELPDYVTGETVALDGVVRYGQVHDTCSNHLYPSAWFEVDAEQVGLD